MPFSVVDHTPGLDPRIERPLRTLVDGLDDCYDVLRGTQAMGGSCVLSSLICRDFLQRVGFGGAEARAVVLKGVCIRDGRTVRRVSAGDPEEAHRYVPVEGRWNGHMCVTLPAEGILVDFALSTLMRPEWDDLVQRGVVVPLEQGARLPGYGGILARIHAPLPSGWVTVTWEASKDRSWRKGPDAKRRAPRADAVEYLLELHRRTLA